MSEAPTLTQHSWVFNPLDEANTSSSLGTSVSSSNHRLGDLPTTHSSMSLCVPCLVTSGMPSRTGSSRQVASRLASWCTASYSPMQFVCLSFRALRGPGVLVSSILVASWHCAVLETSCRCDLQQVFEGSSLVPHAVCDSGLSGQPVAGRLGVVLPCRFPARLPAHFSEQGIQHERPLISFPSGPSLSLVLPFPFAWYVWAHSLTSPLVPHIKLRLRPSISDMCQQPFTSSNVDFALLTPGICQSSVPALIS